MPNRNSDAFSLYFNGLAGARIDMESILGNEMPQ
jgi:hypothetical protein